MPRHQGGHIGRKARLPIVVRVWLCLPLCQPFPKQHIQVGSSCVALLMTGIQKLT